MKKTLVAILALGGMAMADSDLLTLTTDFTKGSTAGNGYTGITFTVTDSTDRYIANPTIKALPSTVSLTGVAIQFRNDGGNTKIANGISMVLADANNKILGVSDSKTAFETLSISSESLINMLNVSFGEGITINTKTQYYAYCVSEETAETLTVGGTLTSDNLGNVNLMVRGQGYTSGAADFGVTAGIKSISGSGYAPVGQLTLVGIVPEPATATLSLLALAGLAARRRRH